MILLYFRIFVSTEFYTIDEYILYWRIYLIIIILMVLCYLIKSTIYYLLSIPTSQSYLVNLFEYFLQYYKVILDSTARVMLNYCFIKKVLEFYANILRSSIWNSYLIYFHMILYLQSKTIIIYSVISRCLLFR